MGCASQNDIAAVPGVVGNPFLDHHVHVVSDGYQEKEGT
jgi:hypothetical protein